MIDQTERLGFRVLRRDKEALQRLADMEGEAMSVIMRRLIRKEAQRHGLWRVHEAGKAAVAERGRASGEDMPATAQATEDRSVP